MTAQRQCVEVPGTPFYWTTSLTDEEICRLYQQLLRARFFIGDAPEEGLRHDQGGSPMIVFGLRFRGEFVEFEGETYEVVLAGDTVIVDRA